jgi:hypothetical protein
MPFLSRPILFDTRKRHPQPACPFKRGGVSKSMLTLNEAIIDVKKG